MKIKVLIVVGNNALNGTEMFALNLAKHLPKDKFIVSVATPLRGSLSEILHENGITEFIYDNGKINKFTFRGIKNIYHEIRKNKYDVVHANSGVLPCIISKLCGVKLVIETKHGLFFTEEKLRKLRLFSFIHEHLKQYYSDYLIAISHNDSQRLEQYFKIKKDKIKIIYNGINLDKLNEYREKKINIEKDFKRNFLLGNIGRLTYQKAQERIINTFIDYEEELNNAEVQIIGEGEDYNQLASQIRGNKLEEKIKIIGYKKNIYDYMVKMDVLLMTSRFEGIPYVILEAMAVGLPVITTDVGGIGNLIKDGINGLIIKGNETKEIKDAILKLKNDRTLYRKIQQSAFDMISGYTVESCTKEYEKLYSKAFN